MNDNLLPSNRVSSRVGSEKNPWKRMSTEHRLSYSTDEFTGVKVRTTAIRRRQESESDPSILGADNVYPK